MGRPLVARDFNPGRETPLNETALRLTPRNLASPKKTCRPWRGYGYLGTPFIPGAYATGLVRLRAPTYREVKVLFRHTLSGL